MALPISARSVARTPTRYMLAQGIAIIYLFPKVTKKIPSPIVAISVVTAIVLIFNIDIKTLGDMGRLTSDLPKFITPNVPFNFETLSIIFPYAISLSIVGIVESLLTAQLIDEMKSDEESHKTPLWNFVSVGTGKIRYTVCNDEWWMGQNLVIKYFDSQKNEIRRAIPDFYLIDFNTIVEIKSTFTLDIQNMKDKFKSYKEFGYNCKCICDYKEIEI